MIYPPAQILTDALHFWTKLLKLFQLEEDGKVSRSDWKLSKA
jgi:hypothetical protein